MSIQERFFARRRGWHPGASGAGRPKRARQDVEQDGQDEEQEQQDKEQEGQDGEVIHHNDPPPPLLPTRTYCLDLP